MRQSLRKVPEIGSEHLNPPDTASTLSMNPLLKALQTSILTPCAGLKYTISLEAMRYSSSPCIGVTMFLHHPQMLSTWEA